MEHEFWSVCEPCGKVLADRPELEELFRSLQISCWERLGFSAFRWRSQPTRSKMKIDRHICGMLRRQWGPAVIQPGTLTACLKALWAVWIRPWIERFWLRLKLLYYIKKKQQNPQFLQYGTSSMLELSTFTVQATRELPSPCAASACRSSASWLACYHQKPQHFIATVAVIDWNFSGRAHPNTQATTRVKIECIKHTERAWADE